MIPNVWSVQEFQKQSSKVFSRGRSLQLEAIDRALGIAHGAQPGTAQGAEALIKVVEAIRNWQQMKAQQGTKSGRARAVTTLLEQLNAASLKLYRNMVSQQNAVDRSMATMRQANMGGLGAIPQGAARMVPGSRQPPSHVPTHVLPGQNLGATANRLHDMLAQAMLDQRKRAMGFDDEDLFEDLDAKQRGRLAARWMLAVPPSVKDVDAARGEALRVLAAMLGNNVSVIRKLFSNNMEVVVIPRDKGMTVLDQFQSIRGQQTRDGRSWDSVRGVGNVTPSTMAQKIQNQAELRELKASGRKAASIVAIDPGKGRIYTAITEENLLGGRTTAPGGGCYAPGYSTTTHEFAHAIHAYGLSAAEVAAIKDSYDRRMRQPESTQWADGPRKVGGQTCYAAVNEFEYFAQLTNAWLGVNTGNDPYTNQPRNNGKQWVIRNEPAPMVSVLDKVYGEAALSDLNPTVILKS